MMARRRWFQFSLRSALLLLTASSLWLGWKVEKTRRHRDAIRAITANGGEFFYAAPNATHAILQIQLLDGSVWLEQPVAYLPADIDAPPIGLAFQGSVFLLGADDVDHISRLKTLEFLDLSDIEIAEVGLYKLHGLKNLKQLAIPFALATSTAIADLENALSQCKVHRLRRYRRQPITQLGADEYLLVAISN
ncbi:MAG TPA: hypothetical protein VG125_23970 [Pirellulales bacterium]|nr:hypothetical protein [Pirellulales bacterium]